MGTTPPCDYIATYGQLPSDVLGWLAAIAPGAALIIAPLLGVWCLMKLFRNVVD